jgi:hypothetical protein
VQGSVGYRTQAGSTQIVVYEGGAQVHSFAAPCPVSAMGVHESFLYVGCADGQLHLFAVDGERARVPAHSGSYRYEHPIRGFLTHQGQFVVDAPAPTRSAAPPAPALAPPMPTSTVEPRAPEGPSPKSQVQRDAELREAMVTRAEKRRLNLGRDMMIGGFSTFGLSYGATLYVGLIASAFGDVRPWFFVPVIGPFVNMPGSETPGLDFLFGFAQLGSVAVGATGAGLYAKEKRRMQVSTMNLRRGAGLRVTYSF